MITALDMAIEGYFKYNLPVKFDLGGDFDL